MTRETRANSGNNSNINSGTDTINISQKKLEEIMQKAISEEIARLQQELRELKKTIDQLCEKFGNVTVNELEVKINSDNHNIDVLEISTDSTDTVINDIAKTETTSNKRNRSHQEKTRYIRKEQPKRAVNVNLTGKQTIVHGTATSDETATFGAAVKRAWLYVGKVRLDTTIEQVNTYLKAKYPGHEFKIELLSKREEATSISFKVGADSDLMDQLYQSENWPKGIIVKKLIFFRAKHGKFS
ncbi:hypothetical protein Zmor_005106 [Zophobas morio]|uniref:Uncharacterized protein n=1 Tax=Zophobas morio TaxID=2755281 RepID=A0AA38MM42_9CUCU|nr:hypothetical protein Zmor_005106 [Zophobas morio]